MDNSAQNMWYHPQSPMYNTQKNNNWRDSSDANMFGSQTWGPEFDQQNSYKESHLWQNTLIIPVLWRMKHPDLQGSLASQL